MLWSSVVCLLMCCGIVFASRSPSPSVYILACVCVCVGVVLHVFLFFVCMYWLTLVSVCDVELGTYGKLKYYHSMTEEGKILSMCNIPTVPSLAPSPPATPDRVCMCMCSFHEISLT